MITVYHFEFIHTDKDLSEDDVFQITFNGDIHRARKLFDAGFFKEVAKVDTTDCNYAFRVTNNIDNSWSREPDSKVTPTAPGYAIARDGMKLGYKSTSIGDIMDRDGELYVVARYGFDKI